MVGFQLTYFPNININDDNHMVTSADNSIVHKDERNCIDSINEDILNWVKEKSIVGMSYIHSEGPKDLIIRSSFKTCLAMNLVPGI